MTAAKGRSKRSRPDPSRSDPGWGAHFTDLQARIDALRGAVGPPAFSWTDMVPGESVVPMVAGQVGVVVGSGGSSVTPAAAIALCASA